MSNMASGNTIAEIAALIGDAARANMLLALMDGRALTAGELARQAGVSPQTTSGHLAKLAASGLLSLEKQGRHHYFRLASVDVAHAMEMLMSVAANGPRRFRPVGPKDEAMRRARACYDHLAGRLGTGLAAFMEQRDYVAVSGGCAAVTEQGQRFLCDFGIEMNASGTSKRPMCRTCLDWSERRMHFAGRLGSALMLRLLELGWIARIDGSRAIRITRDGQRGLAERFGLALDAPRVLAA